MSDEPRDLSMTNEPVVVSHKVPETVVLVEQSLMTSILALEVRMGAAPAATDAAAAAVIEQVMKDAARLRREVEKSRKAVKQPFLDGGRAVDDAAKKPLSLLDDIVGECKTQLADYHNAQQAKAEAHFAEAQRLAEQAPDAGYTQAAALTAAPQVITGVPTMTRKVVDVVDESLLPREYLVPDMPKIRQAALAGVPIPGVTVRDETVVVAR